MTPAEHTLWQKIKNFSLDDPGVSFRFSDRLTRENKWPKAYALRVMEEYKKFLFLCCVTNSGVTPSDPVDQAWHLHLTYTRSYWIDLCKHTLGQDIHHNPTKGGSREEEKFNGFYTITHDLYREKFGTLPPLDIWHDHHTRFTDIHFQRVNVSRHWIIKKPKKKLIILSGCTLVALISIQAIVWDAPNLLFLGILVIFCVVFYRNRGKGNDPSGCTTSSCGSDSNHSGHHGDSGCSSGCSGCSSSGCSGCGGGD